MDLNQSQLKAFEIIAELGSISAAARKLRVTQPALTRRLQNLEAALEAPLFFRLPKGLRLSETGQKLLRYVHQRKLLEHELLGDFSQKEHNRQLLTGTIRVIGYSTFLTTFALPALAPFLRTHPQVQLHHIATQNMGENFGIKNILLSGQADLALSVENIHHSDLSTYEIGKLEMVAICHEKYRERSATLLDTKPSDRTTLEFMLAHTCKLDAYERSYLHDEEGIIRGVEYGLGRALVLKSLLHKSQYHLIDPQFQPSCWTLYLHVFKQNLRPRLLMEVEKELRAQLPKVMGTFG